jgi:glycosyltransferase involved in cell wall biosynthesis
MPNPSRNLLYIDTAYTVSVIRARKHQDFYHARHLGGYFKRVWGVHPLSDIAKGNETCQIKLTRISPRQLIIEGIAESMPWPRFLIPLNFLVSQSKLLFVLIRLIRKHSISAIVATDPYYVALLGLCLKLFCRKPLVVSIYGNYDDIYKETGTVAMPRLFRWRFLEKICERLIFFSANLVLGCNQDHVCFALSNGAREEDTKIFPTSVHMQKCHFVDPSLRTAWKKFFEQFEIPFGHTYLLYVGRLFQRKYPEDVVRAMKIAIDKDPSVIGLLAGDGPMRQELEQLVASFGLDQKIIFLGNIDQEALSQMLPQCIILSPLTGMALIEAGLAGAPIVAYDRDWQAEFIKDNVSGFIVPFRDYDEMGNKALQLVQDQGLRRRFSSEILKTALDLADLDKVFKNQQDIYEEMFEKFYARAPISKN